MKGKPLMPADFLVIAQRIRLAVKGGLLLPPVENFARDRSGVYVHESYIIGFSMQQIHLSERLHDRPLFNFPLRTEYLALVLWFVQSPYKTLFKSCGYKTKKHRYHIKLTDTIELWEDDRLMGWYEDGGKDLWEILSAVINELS
jgi:hypothetical protein